MKHISNKNLITKVVAQRRSGIDEEGGGDGFGWR